MDILKDQKSKILSDITQNIEMFENISFQKEWSVKYRHLLGIRPLTRIKDSYMRWTETQQAYNHYDPLAIAIIMIDHIIAKMEAYSGVSEEDLFNLIQKYFFKIDKHFSLSQLKKIQYRTIFDKILDFLTYKSKPTIYEEEYMDYSQDPPVIRKYQVRIIVYKNFGRETVLHATKTTVNIFLNLLEINIDDQQMANNLILQRQINRGEFGNGIETARRNLVLTNQYSIRLEEIIQDTKHNFDMLDWHTKIPKELEKYTVHLRDVIQDIKKIRSLLETYYQASMSIINLPDIKQIMEIIDQTLSKLLPLQNQISSSNNVFIEEQWLRTLHQKKKSYIALKSTALPAIACLPQIDAENCLDNNIFYFQRPNISHILTLKEITIKLLDFVKIKEKIKLTKLEETEIEMDLKNTQDFHRFSEGIISETKTYLQMYSNEHTSFYFGDLIEDAIESGLQKDHLELLRGLLISFFITQENNKNLDQRLEMTKNTVPYEIVFLDEYHPKRLLTGPFHGNNFLIDNIEKKIQEN
jgi:hypothetical protein